MGSKASGEPSLLLTTSVLYALRHAAEAARDGLAALQLPLADSSTQVQDKDGSQEAACGSSDLGNRDAKYMAFSAPATVVKLKQVRRCFLPDSLGADTHYRVAYKRARKPNSLFTCRICHSF